MGGSEKNIGDQWLKVFDNEKGEAYSPTFFTKKFYYMFTNSRTFKIIEKYLPKRKIKILEPGCGSGKFSVCFALKGHHATALDYSEEILGKCKTLANVAEKKLKRKLDMDFVQGDLTNLKLEENSFDAVFNEGVVEHWLDLDERINVLKQMVKVTKKGGIVVITIPNGAHPYHEKWMDLKMPSYIDAPPMTLYSCPKLKREMEEAGLKVVYTDGLGAIRSLNYFPRNKFIAPFIEILNFIVPLPIKIRKKWGVNIIGVGIKK